MSLRDRIQLIPRQLKIDKRGWLLKLLTGGESDLPMMIGEVYATLALPGQVRGNHYHLECSEWFTVVQGSAQVRVADPTTEERLCFTLAAADPTTLAVSPGIAHAFLNAPNATEPLLIVAYASQAYDPLDTYAYELF